jgi:DNA-directed RNA polymerase specialized sigma24 family protein
MPKKYRIPLILYHFEDLSIKEITGILGTTSGAVRIRLTRGREQLRKLIKEGDNNDYGGKTSRRETLL